MWRVALHSAVCGLSLIFISLLLDGTARSDEPNAAVPLHGKSAELYRQAMQTGRFAKEWVLENQANRPVYNALLAKGEAHPIEAVGAKLRAMMPWLKKDQLVDKTKN